MNKTPWEFSHAYNTTDYEEAPENLETQNHNREGQQEPIHMRHRKPHREYGLRGRCCPCIQDMLLYRPVFPGLVFCSLSSYNTLKFIGSLKSIFYKVINHTQYSNEKVCKL